MTKQMSQARNDKKSRRLAMTKQMSQARNTQRALSQFGETQTASKVGGCLS